MFANFKDITFKVGHFDNFKVLFSVVLMLKENGAGGTCSAGSQLT